MSQTTPPQPQKLAQRDWYGKAIVELGKRDKDVVVLSADLGDSTRAAAFGAAFPDRYFNVGVAEANMMGMASGLAFCGKKPFVSTFAVFATGKAWEQIRQVIAYPCLNVNIVATHAGLTVGEDGASHQILEDLSNMRTLPNMFVIVPADAYETYAAIQYLGGDDRKRGPAYVRLSRTSFPCIYSESVEFRPGKSDILRKGSDVTLFAIGVMVHMALIAADLLAKEGISARVINVSSLKPLDVETLSKALKETGAAVTAEEHQITGGLGSAIAELSAGNCPVPIERVGVNDLFGQSGPAEALLEQYGLTPSAIIQGAKRAIKRKRG